MQHIFLLADTICRDLWLRETKNYRKRGSSLWDHSYVMLQTLFKTTRQYNKANKYMGNFF